MNIILRFWTKVKEYFILDVAILFYVIDFTMNHFSFDQVIKFHSVDRTQYRQLNENKIIKIPF